MVFDLGLLQAFSSTFIKALGKYHDKLAAAGAGWCSAASLIRVVRSSPRPGSWISSARRTCSDSGPTWARTWTSASRRGKTLLDELGDGLRRGNVNTRMKRWLPLVALATAQFVMVLDQSVMNVSISQLVDDFDTTVTTIQAVITLYCLVMAMFMLTGGKIGDIIGRRRAFVIGLVIYACGSALTAVPRRWPC